MKILIVDDELISREKLKVLLSKTGRCDVANSGMQAYDMFCRAFETGAGYDLITLDFNMPILSGPEALQKIREFEIGNGVKTRDKWAKVIMVTARNDHKSMISSYKSGCEGYLTKPFNNEDVQKALASFGI